MTAAFLCVALTPAFSQVLDLGDAQGFNATVFGDITVAGGDTEGRLAVGGNATFTQGGYTIGGAAVGEQISQSSGTRDDLVVGGNAEITPVGGRIGVSYGNVKLGGTKSGPGTFGFDFNGGTLQENVPNFASTVFDFAATESLIRSHSSYFSGLIGNGTVDVQASKIVLTGSSTVQNVFHITAADWTNVGGATEIFVPEGATTVINISGTNITVNGAMSFMVETSPGVFESTEEISDPWFGTEPYSSKTIINPYEATSITSNGFGWQGMVFAPDAHFDADGGYINGQAFLGSLDGTTGYEFHNFYTTVPPIIPEPATLVMTGILLGTCGSVLLIRKKRRS